ncbi:hypothetical protein EN958_30895, partial [Mesorhizobium sp. M7A.F.Ca.CA.002.15.1.1]|uniref:hypothetical protein n=1 Tax=Mesorhizobium sp. M7A.F.Ca.CA.002.15.1.1 TaxID=2496717 RepID=UPI000FD34AA0
MTDNQISNGSLLVQHRAAHFAGHWIANGDPRSRSVRRRLMAVLRMAHSVLGMGRKRLGLGTLGVGGMSAAALRPAAWA